MPAPPDSDTDTDATSDDESVTVVARTNVRQITPRSLAHHVIAWSLCLLPFILYVSRIEPAPHYVHTHPVFVDADTAYLGCFSRQEGWLSPSMDVKSAGLDMFAFGRQYAAQHGFALMGVSKRVVWFAASTDDVTWSWSRECTYSRDGRSLRGETESLAVYSVRKPTPQTA